MNEILRDFLAESSEQLELVGAQLALLQSDRPDARVLANVSRLIHTLKGASGFLNLPQLEAIADAAGALVCRMRDGGTRIPGAAPLLIATVERTKSVVLNLVENRAERAGDHEALLVALRKASAREIQPAQTCEVGLSTSSREPPAPPALPPNALDRPPSLAHVQTFARDRLNGIGTGPTNSALVARLPRASAAPDELPPSLLCGRALAGEPAMRTAVIVVAGGERMAVPSDSILRGFELGPGENGVASEPSAVAEIETTDGTLPLVRLDRLFVGYASAAEPRTVLQIEAGRTALAILVDEIIGFQDVVVAPLPVLLRGLPLYSGVAALNDGSAVMVLDPDGLAAALGASPSRGAQREAQERPGAKRVASSVVVFRAGEEPPRALPIHFDLRALRPSEAQSLQANQEGETAIEGRSVPKAWLNDGESPRSANTVLLLEEGEGRVALAVEEAIDTVGDSTVEFATGRLGALGVGGVRGAATEILDPHFFLDRRKRRRLAGPSPTRKRLLLVEPDAFFRDMMTEALIRRGFRVCAFGSVSTAAGEAPPADLLLGALVDIDAAGVDGGAWLRTLRGGFGDMHAAPLFGLATHAGVSMRRRASILGLTCVFGKFDRQGILGALALAESPLVPEKAA